MKGRAAVSVSITSNVLSSIFSLLLFVILAGFGRSLVFGMQFEDRRTWRYLQVQ